MKCKENIKTQKDRIAQLQTENEAVRANEAKKNDEMENLHVYGVLYWLRVLSITVMLNLS